jgi:hypothetical protein
MADPGGYGKLWYSPDAATWAPQNATGVPPTAPRSLTATVNSYSQITLSWAAPSTPNDMVGYQIRYKVGSAPSSPTDGTFVANTASLSYVHANLSAVTTYGYYVFGYTNDGQAGPGATTTATTPVGIPTVPLNFRVSSADYNTIVLAWDAPSAPGGLSGYQVRWGDGSIPGSNTAGSLLGNTAGLTMTHDGLAESHYYGYRVFGYTAQGDQGPAATVGYTTPARPTSSGDIGTAGQCGGCYQWKQSSAATTSTGFTMPVNGYISSIDMLVSGYGATGRVDPYVNGTYKGERDLGSTSAGSPGWNNMGMGNQYLPASGGYTFGFRHVNNGSYKTQWGYSSSGGSNSVCGTVHYWYYTALGERDTHTITWLGPLGEIAYEKVFDKETGVLLSARGKPPEECDNCGQE